MPHIMDVSPPSSFNRQQRLAQFSQEFIVFERDLSDVRLNSDQFGMGIVA